LAEVRLHEAPWHVLTTWTATKTDVSDTGLCKMGSLLQSLKTCHQQWRLPLGHRCTTCYKCGGGCCQLVSTAAQASTPVQKKRLQRPCVSTVAQRRTSMSQGPLHVSNVVGTPVFFRSPSRYSVAPPKRTSVRGLRSRRPSGNDCANQYMIVQINI
jgi:hypothetical protein